MKIKVNADFEFFGIEQRPNRKSGEIYYFICLLQGFDMIKIYANDDVLLLFKDFEKLDKLNCNLEVSINERTYLNILDVKKI